MNRRTINTGQLSPSQLKIAQWIQQNGPEMMLSTEQEIAKSVGVSIASVSRFWRMIGYKNLKDYKQKWKQDLEVTPAKKMMNTIGDLQHTDLQILHLNKSIGYLQVTLNRFNKDIFNQAADVIQKCDRLYIYAPGPSAALGELMKYRLSRFGILVLPLQKWGSELFEDLVHMNRRCAVILFAFSRILREGEVILKQAGAAGYKTIVITDQAVLQTQYPFDLLLYACRGEKNEFHSMIAPMYLIENMILTIGENQKDDNMRRLDRLSMLRKKYKEDLPR